MVVVGGVFVVIVGSFFIAFRFVSMSDGAQKPKITHPRESNLLVIEFDLIYNSNSNHENDVSCFMFRVSHTGCGK